MASIELKEKNGVMTEVVRIADFLNNFDFACEEFERVLGNYGKFDWIRVGHNASETLFRNVMESNVWERTEECEDAFDKFVTFAIELNMINKG